MGRTVGIGIQDFEKVIEGNYFYIDKTNFIKEWWESGDDVTLIARPRRFGKTLNMSMLNRFFSLEYKGQSEIFEGFSIWQDEKYRKIQGSYPVINLSFANVKEQNFADAKKRICQLLTNLYSKFYFLRDSALLTDKDKQYFDTISADMDSTDATFALYQLSDYLHRYYGQKVIILLDEYDTPMQEAYVNGFWDEWVAFIRSMFNAAFKTNPYLARAVMTGITRVSKESIFSDLNNLKVVTTTSDEYATSFGFTEKEVFIALEECAMGNKKDIVKEWYDGFIFGSYSDIYNPWSILNFLDTGIITTYWANTSSNSLVGKLLREGNGDIKKKFEQLMQGKHLYVPIDEQIVYNNLNDNEEAIWSLLLASGYLKVLGYEHWDELEYGQRVNYELAITNREVRVMFEGMVNSWFHKTNGDYNAFIKAMFKGDSKSMNVYMNRVALTIFSYFDTGNRPTGQEPERFYHGFVLGLVVDLQNEYIVSSNRESGFGRYDVIIEPKNPEKNHAVIIEFKVIDEEDENTLKHTAQAALDQIEEKQYAAALLSKGITADRIYKYGFAFEGKKVWIEKADN
ncbi:MAG: AAA family ATPase [Lachnospiraceae bacterium]|nr:AAA family ATPase [Lachnospiraceae bacterium]